MPKGIYKHYLYQGFQAGHIKYLGSGCFKKNCISWSKGKKLPQYSGEKANHWKGGMHTIPELINKYQRERRHSKGISKRYFVQSGLSYTKEYKKLHMQRYRALRKQGGLLTVERIQLVYEDNIKKYGTLTCYLCEKPIVFGQDHLEHKIPLSRNGNNAYSNLAVACEKCNKKKGRKTEEEYKKRSLS